MKARSFVDPHAIRGTCACMWKRFTWPFRPLQRPPHQIYTFNRHHTLARARFVSSWGCLCLPVCRPADAAHVQSVSRSDWKAIYTRKNTRTHTPTHTALHAAGAHAQRITFSFWPKIYIALWCARASLECFLCCLMKTRKIARRACRWGGVRRAAMAEGLVVCVFWVLGAGVNVPLALGAGKTWRSMRMRVIILPTSLLSSVSFSTYEAGRHPNRAVISQAKHSAPTSRTRPPTAHRRNCGHHPHRHAFGICCMLCACCVGQCAPAMHTSDWCYKMN